MLGVTVLGNGNVGSFFAQLCSTHPQLNLVQWYGRNKNFLPTVKTEKISQLSALKQTDLLLLCIKDDALATLAQKITVSGLVVHTSGSVHINVLEQHSLHGVCYPLQTISKSEFPNVNEVPLCIEGNNAVALDTLKHFATLLGMPQQEINSEQRKTLHLAAVFSNNFANHLFARAAALCEQQQVDFKLLLPLLTRSVQQLHTQQPIALQTGPARRQDKKIVAAHLELLEEATNKEIYTLLTKAIQEYYGEEL
ncbi:MAG: Rossmann-like and DUF2520 domain-containing protein [Flavobacteriaceae bacterium]